MSPVVVAVLMLSSGCSSQQLYATGQAYQRNQCYKIPDDAGRESCLERAGKSYDEYKRETDETRE